MPDQPRARGKLLSAAIALVASIALASLAASHSRDVGRVDALKAGYLLNFMKFVEWPAHAPAATFTVCFLGNSGVHDELSTGLHPKRLGTHRLITRRLAPAESAAACQVLYIDAEHLAHIAPLIVEPPAALLTVSDAPQFLQSGGIIGLFAEGDRLRFRISVENARRANLRISSHLLQLASAVEREG
jgi:uncharacterized protein DUF4154